MNQYSTGEIITTLAVFLICFRIFLLLNYNDRFCGAKTGGPTIFFSPKFLLKSHVNGLFRQSVRTAWSALPLNSLRNTVHFWAIVHAGGNVNLCLYLVDFYHFSLFVPKIVTYFGGDNRLLVSISTDRLVVSKRYFLSSVL